MSYGKVQAHEFPVSVRVSLLLLNGPTDRHRPHPREALRLWRCIRLAYPDARNCRIRHGNSLVKEG